MFAFCLLAALAAGGCGGSQKAAEEQLSGRTPSFDRLIVLMVDVSQSTEELRPQIIASAMDISDVVGPRDRLLIYKFGRGINEVHDGEIGDLDAFQLHLRKSLEASDPEGGTDYSQVATKASQVLENAPEDKALCIVLGDGQNDFRWDSAMAARYKSAADSLAKRKKLLALRFWGLSSKPQEFSPHGGPQEEIKAVFKGLGSKLQLRTVAQDALQ